VPPRKTSAPIFCYVTDRAGLRSSEPREPLTALLDCIASAAAAGVRWIQLREKHLAARDLTLLTRAAVDRCTPVRPGVANSPPTQTRIFVNDRLDVAIAERTAGVHLGENSLPVNEAKRLLQGLSLEDRPAEFLAGVSCHSLASAQAAAAAGADYIFFGPIFPTPSKQMYGPAQGLQRLAEVCRAVDIPVLGIGGINMENAADCLDSGASGIAAIRLFQQPRELQAAAAFLRSFST
jgi:thiamine-phosphate pyrophosphorylase